MYDFHPCQSIEKKAFDRWDATRLGHEAPFRARFTTRRYILHDIIASGNLFGAGHLGLVNSMARVRTPRRSGWVRDGSEHVRIRAMICLSHRSRDGWADVGEEERGEQRIAQDPESALHIMTASRSPHTPAHREKSSKSPFAEAWAISENAKRICDLSSRPPLLFERSSKLLPVPLVDSLPFAGNGRALSSRAIGCTSATAVSARKGAGRTDCRIA
ncbi:hypothetical protein B0J12DRAFT_454273 [Macrophomina phaseolina]|uniref:Uncharacterized protein n=1 Tax=Macrophomina phaseolina TaxID=35725 RepID=A0ABQ8GFP7_9PEZI|nr:hypothetical protein B0J12DRAFT_454273 [Macrophomina phaseolina]